MYMVSLPMSVIMMLSATFWTARPSTLTGPMFARAPLRAAGGSRRFGPSACAQTACALGARLSDKLTRLGSGLFGSFPRTHTCKASRGHEDGKEKLCMTVQSPAEVFLREGVSFPNLIGVDFWGFGPESNFWILFFFLGLVMDYFCFDASAWASGG